MPVYEYACAECGKVTEALQKVSDAPLKECPECHKPSLSKIVSRTSFQLKGTGWYATDYKGSGSKKEAKSEPSTPSSEPKTPPKGDK